MPRPRAATSTNVTGLHHCDRPVAHPITATESPSTRDGPRNSSAPAAPGRVRVSHWETTTRSPPGRCGARALRRGLHVATRRPAADSPSRELPITCSERPFSAARCPLVMAICVCKHRWTNVLLRDGRRSRSWRADVAQLVAHHLAKVRVAGSNPVIRSKVRLWHQPQRWSGRVVRQRPAKPCTRVRFPSPPPRNIFNPRD